MEQQKLTIDEYMVITLTVFKLFCLELIQLSGGINILLRYDSYYCLGLLKTARVSTNSVFFNH